jgi:hypothetical protein
VTLLEALTAIFIMAIGLLALLTLFPIGAMSMAQAIKDDRCAQTASQADGLMRVQWRAAVLEAVRQGVIPTEMAFAAMDDPNLLERRLHPSGTPGWHRLRFLSDLPQQNASDPYYLPAPLTIPGPGPGISQTSLVVDNNNGSVTTNPMSNSFDVIHVSRSAVPSYPVLIDPIGYFGRRATDPERYWVGRSAPNLPSFPANAYPGLLLPRRSMLGITDTAGGQPAALAVFSITDDLSFTTNGTPDGRLPNGSVNPNGAQLRRQGRYSWAALMQRPRNDDLTTATLKILVFDGRSPLPQGGDEVMVVQPNTAVGSRQIVVTVPARSPELPAVVRKGGWVLDGTMQVGPTGIRNDFFYRIVGVTEIGTGAGGTTYALDIDPPLKTPTVATGTTPPTTYDAQFYFFANLAEVFERPPLRADLENTTTN